MGENVTANIVAVIIVAIVAYRCMKRIRYRWKICGGQLTFESQAVARPPPGQAVLVARHVVQWASSGLRAAHSARAASQVSPSDQKGVVPMKQALRASLIVFSWTAWLVAKAGFVLQWPWVMVVTLEGIARALP